MKWKVPLFSGAFIILEFCFSSVEANCRPAVGEENEVVAKAIKDFRQQYIENDKYDVEWEETGTAQTKVEAALGDNPTEDSQDFLHYNNEKTAITAPELDRIMKEWIKTGDDYKFGDQLKDKKKYPFFKLLWKGTSKATCTICATGKNYEKKGFGCVFSPPATLTETDVAKIKENLPEKIKEPDHDKKDSPAQSAIKGFSKFEKIVRILVLISIIAAVTIVILGFVVAILVAIKIFV